MSHRMAINGTLIGLVAISFPFAYGYNSDGPMALIDKAKIALDQGHPETAARLLESIFRDKSVNNPVVVAGMHLYLGECYAKTGKLDKAEKELVDGLTVLSRRGLERYALLKVLLRVYLAQDRPQEALAVISAIKQESKFSAAAYTETEDLLKQRLNGFVSPDSLDYIRHAFDSNLLMPPHAPLFKVWIEPSSNIPAEYYDVVQRSLNEWSASTQSVRFSIVKDKKNADVDINWVVSSDNIDSLENGSTRVACADRRISHATISIQVVDDPQTMSIQVINAHLYKSPEAIHRACLHQIGHAMGISKHSCNSADVMYCSEPFSFENIGPTARDAKTIKTAYSASLLQQLYLSIWQLAVCVRESWFIIAPAIVVMVFRQRLGFILRKAKRTLGQPIASNSSGARRSVGNSISARQVLTSIVSFLGSLAAWTALSGNNFHLAMALMMVLLLHETGHYIAARALQARPELPIFLVAVAFVRIEQEAEDLRVKFIIAAAGPFLGAVTAALFLLFANQQSWMMQAASFGFALNLLQMTPVPPFDGGHMVEAIDRRLWHVGSILVICYALASLLQGNLAQGAGLILVWNSSRNYMERKAGEDSDHIETLNAAKMRYAIFYFGLTAALVSICLSPVGSNLWWQER